MGVIDDFASSVGRYGDDAVEAIRRLLGYDSPAPPPRSIYAEPPTRGKVGGDVRAAVEANDAQRMLRAAQARKIGLADEATKAVNDTWDARGAAQDAAAVGGAVAAAAGVGALANRAKAPQEGVTSTEGTADLANESRPAPVVEPDEEAERQFTDTFKRQYLEREQKRAAPKAPKQASPAMSAREQAHALIKQLNQMRMDARGEVPQAPQMMAQINRLLAQANQEANSRSAPQAQQYAAQNPNDPHAQAQVLIAQLNARTRQLGYQPPDTPRIMAEVRRLHAMGDQMRNSQTAGRRY